MTGRWTPRRAAFCALGGSLGAFGLALAALLALGLQAARAADAGRVDVVVTIKPIHSLVAKVMEGVDKPLLLVDGGASPHSFALRPSQMQAVGKSAVLFRVSERLEPFTGKLVRALPQGVQVVSLVDAPGLRLLELRHTGTFEPHRHEDGDGEHAEDAEHADSHIWLDPENAKAMVAEIARVLAAASPGDAPLFERNAARVTAEIDALEAKLSGELQPVRGKPFVVFHDAYQYFERRFGLDALGSITVSPESAPSARRLIEIRRKIKALGAVCVFGEPQFSASLVDAVAEGTGARTGMLDPEGALVEPGPNAYGELMGNLAAGFVSCLGQGS